MPTVPSRPVSAPPAAPASLDLDLDAAGAEGPDTIPDTQPLTPAGAGERPPAHPERLPTIGHIGRYALKYVIGEGGLGTVYAAYDPLLSRLIAIKTLHVDLPQADRARFDALFLNEARAAGSLNHAHIVTVYDAGTSERGPYIAMELLKGKDLRQGLQSGWRPTPVQAALIVRRVADALSYAHHKGVIHRDIKPANIFMVGRTQPCVLDFGIARIRQVESLAQRDDPQSRFQDIAGGSPFYMAPEQVRHQPVDHRVDVYALGAVLYELLTGQRAVQGDTLEGIAEAVLTGKRPTVRELNPAVPAALSAIVEQAMAHDPARRTRSARFLAQSLRDWLQTAEGTSAADSEAEASVMPGATAWPRGGRRHRWVSAGASAVALGAAGALWWQLADPRGEQAPLPADRGLSSAAAASASALLPASPPRSALTLTPTMSPPPQAASGPAPSVPDATPGLLKLAISPWGEVDVDGQVMGVTPPLTQLKLAPGTRTITIRNGDAPVFRQTVDVQPGRELRIRHQF